MKTSGLTRGGALSITDDVVVFLVEAPRPEDALRLEAFDEAERSDDSLSLGGDLPLGFEGGGILYVPIRGGQSLFPFMY